MVCVTVTVTPPHPLLENSGVSVLCLYITHLLVRGIGFHDDRGIRNEVSENGHSGEGMLKCIERMSTVLGEIPRGILLCELGKGDHYVRVVKDEPAVEIGKA